MRNDAVFTALLVSVFLSLGCLGLVTHEMWRDELQAWLIGRDSPSLRDLFANYRYESHPGVWFAILYLLTRFTRNPAAMQVSHLIIAAAVIFIFARFSPFTNAQKVLFSFGYFPFYEYAVISRNYAIGILCIFSFCALFQTRTKRYLFLSSILFVLANTSVYGLILAMCFGLTLLFECMIDRGMRRSLPARKSDLIISVLVFALGIVTSIAQILPPADRAVVGTWVTRPDRFSVVKTLMTVWMSYIPIPSLSSYQFWNTNILLDGSLGSQMNICAGISLGLLAISVGLFVRKPVVLFLYLSGTLGLLAFIYAVVFGKLAHHGHLFILFVASLWISQYYTETRLVHGLATTIAEAADRVGKKFVMVMLYADLAAGLIAFGTDVLHPFSASKEASRFIASRQSGDMLIAGSRDSPVSPLSAYLNSKIYYPESDRFGSFIVWNRKRKRLDAPEVLEKVGQLITHEKKDVLLVLNYRLLAHRPDLTISKLSEFSHSIIPDETYYLYLVQRKST
jgi:hypothetical protein